MEITKKVCFTVHLEKEEIDILMDAREIIQSFFNTFDEEGLYYGDYINVLSEKTNVDEDNIVDVLLRGNNIPIDLDENI